jgi:hypothetical protein
LPQGRKIRVSFSLKENEDRLLSSFFVVLNIRNKTIKSRMMRWATYVVHVEMKRNLYKFLVGKLEGHIIWGGGEYV